MPRPNPITRPAGSSAGKRHLLFPSTMAVDSVRVYRRDADKPTGEP